jgi:hypothetical protein
MKLPVVVANFHVFIFISVVEVIISIKGFLASRLQVRCKAEVSIFIFLFMHT